MKRCHNFGYNTLNANVKWKLKMKLIIWFISLRIWSLKSLQFLRYCILDRWKIFKALAYENFLGSKLIPNRCSMFIRIELVRNNAPASKSKVKWMIHNSKEANCFAKCISHITYKNYNCLDDTYANYSPKAKE